MPEFPLADPSQADTPRLAAYLNLVRAGELLMFWMHPALDVFIDRHAARIARATITALAVGLSPHVIEMALHIGEQRELMRQSNDQVSNTTHLDNE